MPKHNTDFSRTKIYKIVCKDLNMNHIYIGHTTDFIRRKCKHKQDCNNPEAKNYHVKLYKTIRENGGWDNWDMILVEDFPCKNKLEASARERYYYELLNGSLNTNKPNRNLKEYYQDNKNKILEYQNNYNNNNKDKLKEYREANKDKIKEYNSNYRIEYYKKNKDKFKDRAHQEYNCVCGACYTYSGKSQHFKSKKHLNFIKSEFINGINYADNENKIIDAMFEIIHDIVV